MDQLLPGIQSNESTPCPRIVYGEGFDGRVSVDPEAAAQAMRELGTSETTIANSAVFIDPKNRLISNGTHYPNILGRLRFRSVTELQEVEGKIIRLSTKVKSKKRTEEQMNKTAIHEWEHLAQADRCDTKVVVGRIAIYGLAGLGALVGSRFGEGAKSKINAAIGGLLGYQLGYLFAPHERQARLRAGQVSGIEPRVVSKAVHRKI